MDICEKMGRVSDRVSVLHCSINV